MALPASYTENDLSDFLHWQAGAVADLLAWSVAGRSYDEIINDTLAVYGVDTIAAATDVRKLRALARLQLWKAVVAATVPEIDFTADGATFNREAIFAHAERQLQQARIDSMPYDDAYGYSVDSLSVDRNDPYESQVI